MKQPILILGAGHNGLVCACYLARAGHKVTLLERRHIVGGAAVTEEIHPGFRNSTASYTVSLLNPKIIKDLNLAEHGLKVVLRGQSNLFPQENGDSLSFYGNVAANQQEFARFSQKDADALPGFYRMLDSVADLIKDLLLQTPPNVGGGIVDLIRAGKVGWRAKAMTMDERRWAMAMFTKSATEVLDAWFEHDAIKAAFAFDSIVGNYAAPSTPGSAYVLLHHVFGEANGVAGAWGHAIGGMGAITQAMAAEAKRLGVDIITDASVSEVLVDNGRARGVKLEDGREYTSDCLVANMGPKLLFERLMAPEHLPEDFRRHLASFKTGSGSFRMNVALSELPDFLCRPGTQQQPHHTSGIVIGPTMQYLEQAYLDAKQSGYAKHPIVEMLIPSVVDDTLAPKGQHVASLFCQQFAPQLPNGDSWDDHREAAADTIIDTVTRYAPNFKASVIARQIHSPLDLERKFGLVNGDIFHGALGLDQLWLNRPLMGHADYRTPIKGLYLCGSGTHPGGGVTGCPGHNAAREILRDL
ncbi:phytoene desaturase family protein [Simiduia agarivorans]|uniref:Pyridine nucleotide-disulfide oxidoreductase domain-containing protein 2 n=1 Tax=Simiduia agarivorans (strain DSM 21679 / JCM 13881 / BCRC 17597 / SA1) TaxID=1117647 RepID=K4KHG1_SIMAS|nr:NAD(P)/FAD-dependent oxidoreductase [Simiduia agarivorans]AFU97393.1 FAD dependent oxidoreductase [Simiduia agarivorans SA1 = DSM 21679]